MQVVAAEEERKTETRKRQRIGIVADAASGLYPGVEWRLVAGEAEGEAHQFSGAIEALDLQQYVSAQRFPQRDRDLLATVRKLSPADVLRFLKEEPALWRFVG